MRDVKMDFTKSVEEVLVNYLQTQELVLVTNTIIKKLADYDLNEKCTALAVYDDTNERLLRKYCACLLVNGKSKKTIKQYNYTCRKLADFIQKNYTEMSDYDMWRFLGNEMERGVSNSTRENTRSYLSAFFKWLFDEKIISDNPMIGIKPIQCEKEIKLAFSDIEVDLIRNACRNFKERAIVEMLISTGIRVSELVSMKVKDIDQSSLLIHIKNGKGGKDRITFITPVGFHHVSKYLQNRNESGEYLFYNKNHENLSTNGVRFILNTIGKRAGVKNVHPHRFRRTFATNLSKRGMNAQDIQRLMGHANSNTTMTYIALDNAALADAYNRYSS